MSNYFTSYFQFTARERKGLLILSVMLMIVIGLKYGIHHTEHNPKFKVELLETARVKLVAAERSAIQTRKIWFHFNPNTMSIDSMNLLPIPDYLNHRMKKMIEKGRIFKSKSEVSRIYGMKPDLFSEMKPWLLLPDSNVSFSANRDAPAFVRKEVKRINLNLADSVELEKLPGIGPYLASIMVKYRNRLGGYLHIDQLLELKGMRKETLEEMRPYVYINASEIQRINLNHCEVSDAGKHPYIGFQQAKRIIQYRNVHGNFRQARDILKIHGTDTSWLQKVEPYLQFE